MGNDPGNAPPEEWSEQIPEREEEEIRLLLRQALRGGDDNGDSSSGDPGRDGRLGSAGR